MKPVKNSVAEMSMKLGLYHWCKCELSNTQPFCDNSIFGTGIEPMDIQFDEEGIVYWSVCKKSSTNPISDGTISEEFKGDH